MCRLQTLKALLKVPYRYAYYFFMSCTYSPTATIIIILGYVRVIQSTNH